MLPPRFRSHWVLALSVTNKLLYLVAMLFNTTRGYGQQPSAGNSGSPSALDTASPETQETQRNITQASTTWPSTNRNSFNSHFRQFKGKVCHVLAQNFGVGKTFGLLDRWLSSLGTVNEGNHRIWPIWSELDSNPSLTTSKKCALPFELRLTKIQAKSGYLVKAQVLSESIVG